MKLKEMVEMLGEVTGTTKLQNDVKTIGLKLDNVMELLKTLFEGIEFVEEVVEPTTVVTPPEPTVAKGLKQPLTSKKAKEMRGGISVIDFTKRDLGPDSLKFTELRITPIKPNSKSGHYGIRLMLRGLYRNGVISHQVYLGSELSDYDTAFARTKNAAEFFCNRPGVVADVLTILHRQDAKVANETARAYLSIALA